MSEHCCPPPAPGADPRYRRILWIALAVNAAMFLVEIGASATSGSAALAADAVDFAGDAAWLCTRNDAISNLAVLAAALGVFGTGTFWPDVAVAALMASLALYSSAGVILHARSEFRARLE